MQGFPQVEFDEKGAAMSIRGFHDRRDAGRQLAAKLRSYARRADVLVLALPRGGVPVGFEIASALHVALDVIVVRKLGVPEHEELAMGAIATGGVRVLNTEIIEELGISNEVIDQVTMYEQEEMERREHLYRELVRYMMFTIALFSSLMMGLPLGRQYEPPPLLYDSSSPVALSLLFLWRRL